MLMGALQRLVLERGQISEAVARTRAEDTLGQVGRGQVGRVEVSGDLQTVAATTGGEGEDDGDEEKLTVHCGYLLPIG